MIALLVPLRPQREQEQRRPEAALPLLCWLPPRPRRRPRQSAAASPRRPRPGSAEPRRRSCRATGGGADAGGGRERRGEDEEARRSPLPLEQRKADEARPQRLSAPWLSSSSSLPLGPPLPQRLRETAAAAASLRPPREPAAAEAAAPAAAAAGRARQAPQPPRRRRCSRLPRVARRRSLPCPPCCSTKGPVALRGRSTRAAPRRRRRGRLRFGGSFGGKEGFVRVREREKEGERDEKKATLLLPLPLRFFQKNLDDAFCSRFSAVASLALVPRVSSPDSCLRGSHLEGFSSAARQKILPGAS